MKVGPFDSLVEAQRIQALLQDEGFEVDLAPGDNFMGLTSCSLFVHGIQDLDEIREIIENYSMGNSNEEPEDQSVPEEPTPPSFFKDLLIYSGIAICIYILQVAPLSLSFVPSANKYSYSGVSAVFTPGDIAKVWMGDALMSGLIFLVFSLFYIFFFRINPLKETGIKVYHVGLAVISLFALHFWDIFLLEAVAPEFSASTSEERTQIITHLGHLPYLGTLITYWAATCLLCQGVVFEVFQKRHNTLYAVLGSSIFSMIVLFSISLDYFWIAVYLLGLSLSRALSSSFPLFLALYLLSLLGLEVFL